MLDKIDLTKIYQSSLEYPKEYNPRVHGPFNPSVYYGPKTQAFSEVKLGDVAKWIGQREKSWTSIVNMASRGMCSGLAQTSIDLRPDVLFSSSHVEIQNEIHNAKEGRQ
jgi:hypothetical protein